VDPYLVSIGMPVYNGERYIKDAIRSNLAQTHSNIELIIADNASTDRTEEICRDFARADGRIRYERNSRNIGAAANYNKLFALARGEYFRWSNADDLVAPELVERTLAVLKSRDDVVIAFGGTCLIDASGAELGEYCDNLDLQQPSASERYITFDERLGLTNIIYGLMRASAMRRTNLMGDGRLRAADVHFMASMVLLGKFVAVPGVLLYRRMHDQAFSSLKDAAQEQNFWKPSKNAPRLPEWRTHLAYTAAIARAPVPMRDKRRLLAFSLRRMVWQRSQLARELLGLLAHRA
jgi:glycosyltransferase involved in cell wall biosynthesis